MDDELKIYSVEFAETAIRQIAAIREYIAVEADGNIANRFASSVISHGEGLNLFPHRGSDRSDIRPGLRTISYKKRTVLAFDVDDTESIVTIYGVFYGGQDINAWFDANPV